MDLSIRKTKISGCYELLPKKINDERGFFVKTFHLDVFNDNNLETSFAEEYYSLSHRGVLRGLHFQVPPQEHTKLVYCVYGQVMDVVVDLRVGSPTYGKFQVFELNSESANMIYVPQGLAHGFLTVSEKAIMLYKVTTVYSPEHDVGVLWNSLGIPWSIAKPVVSKRDNSFTSFSDFKSPFVYKKGGCVDD